MKQVMINLWFFSNFKETRLKFNQGSVTILHMLPNYQEVWETNKFRNKRLSTLKPAEKNKTGTILRINKKNFKDE